MFLGYYDPDKKRPTSTKLNDAIERYTKKFGSAPVLCLTSAPDALDLGDATPIPVRAVSYIGRHTFYVGVEDTQEVRSG